MSDEVDRLRASGCFEAPEVRDYEVDEVFDSEAFAGRLSTFSPMIALADEERQAFLQDVVRVVDEDFGGSIVHRSAFSLVVAKRHPE